ncbi:MAG: hypothetical protein WCR97_00045 [Bacilli bacterium]
MKKYCVYCGKEIKNEQCLCSSCKKDNSFKNLNEEEMHVVHQNCHKKINKCSEIKNNMFSYVVIGAILLVICFIFFYLSFKYNIIKQRVFSPGSLEFVVCCLCGAGSCFCLIYGIINLIIVGRKTKYYKSVIEETHKK